MKRLTIATRGSKLALWQSNHIKSLIEVKFGIDVDLKIIKTTGDKILDTPLAKIGGKGLFTKEIEEAMLNGEAQLSVHSLKDFPIEFPNELKLSAITKREDVRDSLLSEKFDSLDSLPKGAIIGTTSLRRKMQLLSYRDDLIIKDLRGNVDTRINKLKNGEFDAIILAQAGLNRLDINSSVKFVYPIETQIMIPAMGQASLAIETIDNEEVLEFVKFLNDERAYIETKVERDFITKLNGGCQVPIGINASLNGDILKVSAIVGYPDGSRFLRESITTSKDEFKNIGTELAELFIQNGARDILDKVLTLF